MSKPTLRQSTLGTLETCAFQIEMYERYGPMPPGVAMVRGTAFHRVQAADMTSKIETGDLLKDDAVKDAAADLFDETWDGPEGVRLAAEERESGEDKVRGETKDSVVAMAEKAHEELNPTLVPVGVEEPFLVEIDGFPYDLSGTMDLVEPKGIRDFKTKTKSPAKDAAQKSVQGVHYCMAEKIKTGVAPEYFALDTLVSLKSGAKYVPQQATFGEQDFKAHLLRLERAAQVLTTGSLMPAPPESWVCSEKWCGWFGVCEFGAKGRSRTNGG